MNKFKPIVQFKSSLVYNRYFSSSQCLLFKTKAKTDSAETPPKWNEKMATESEADVKADKEPFISPEKLTQDTTEWVRSHKDKDGNIPPQ